ncbi:hypothetical protein GBAR_LOCUS19872 [Geodia barretti]|uniref:DDE-1 domain-containing protein n=1 Tax=Geodia barretti TaxID=519541 RepID=A0AA35SUW0_GEOBA|nr:hypothetical protein GBAR_LOCUS19872 [Geodia barretti]
MASTKQTLGLDEDHFSLALFDVFAAHMFESVLQALETHHIKCCFIPPNCMGVLQPLDLTVNQVFKQERFIRWYAGLVKDQLRDGVQLEILSQISAYQS